MVAKISVQQYDAPLTVYHQPSNLFVADFVVQVRIGYWKAKIYRPKVKEIIDGAFGRWRKAGRLDY